MPLKRLQAIRRYLPGLIIFTLYPGTQFVIADADSSTKQTAVELESVRIKIKDVESKIQAAQNESDQLLRILQDNEIAATDISNKLQAIDGQIGSKITRLAELKIEKKSTEGSLAHERNLLAQQIRAAYKMGKKDYLKLLLNQEDPALVGRMLVYYDYYNRARVTRIDKVNASLQEIADLEQSIQAETTQLDGLRADQLSKLEEFSHYRISRREIIAKLKQYIEQQDRQLQILQRNEQELESLFHNLKVEETAIQLYEEVPPFTKLRGKLNWPVQGRTKSRFGGLRKGGKLTWQGVMIAANSGTEVAAISAGKVIFADWFRNMGLLIILDHGEGYMSLYGHNERLVKKVGDWVNSRENIAKVGDTGGQQHPGLYFEIRQNGDPLNPDIWCKK